MIDRGDTTTRDRDFADVALLARRHHIDARRLAAPIAATSSHRQSELRPLAQALNALPASRQADWDRYIRRAGLQDQLPKTYADAIAAVVAFADPILTRTVTSGHWDPSHQEWQN